MQNPRIIGHRLLPFAALLLLFVPAAVPAHAVSKEMVQLQTQVQQLLDMVQRLQSTLDSRFGVIQDLAQQTAEQAKQMTQTVNALQQKLNTQNDAINGKQDALSGQMQSLNDSVDELKARIAKLDKSVQDLQTQLQTMQTQQQQQQSAPGAGQPGMQPGGTIPPGGTMPPGGQPNSGGPDQGPGMPNNNAMGGNAPGPSPALQAPPLQETFQSGERDFDAGKFKVAQGEFQSIVHYYPLDDLAGTAQFYLGEIAYQQKDYPTAINYYNGVLEGFSGNAKAPAAELHKAYCLLATDKRQAGVDEMRELIRRHPQTPEARAARSKMNGMGVRITAGTGH